MPFRIDRSADIETTLDIIETVADYLESIDRGRRGPQADHVYQSTRRILAVEGRRRRTFEYIDLLQPERFDPRPCVHGSADRQQHSVEVKGRDEAADERCIPPRIGGVDRTDDTR